MKTALIKNGKVENIIKSTTEHNEVIKDDYEALIDVTSVRVNIGWVYDGIQIVAPVKTQEELDKEAAQAAKDQVVRDRREQMKTSLLNFSTLSALEKDSLLKKLAQEVLGVE